jgi:hypothetical protein
MVTGRVGRYMSLLPGPFTAQRDSWGDPRVLACKHIRSVLDGLSLAPRFPPPPERYCPEWPADSVASITVTIRTRNGQAYTTTFHPDSVDVVFFTASAVDKFAISYYAHLFGAAYAAQLRNHILGGTTPP